MKLKKILSVPQHMQDVSKAKKQLITESKTYSTHKMKLFWEHINLLIKNIQLVDIDPILNNRLILHFVGIA